MGPKAGDDRGGGGGCCRERMLRGTDFCQRYSIREDARDTLALEEKRRNNKNNNTMYSFGSRVSFNSWPLLSCVLPSYLDESGMEIIIPFRIGYVMLWLCYV